MPVYQWDEEKRRANLEKHGYDFELGRRVYENPNVMTARSDYAGEARYVDIAPWGNELLVLVYTKRGDVVRPISLRAASKKERMFYEKNRRQD
jgi:uncharacterized DUF497 family protein